MSVIIITTAGCSGYNYNSPSCQCSAQRKGHSTLTTVPSQWKVFTYLHTDSINQLKSIISINYSIPKIIETCSRNTLFSIHYSMLNKWCQLRVITYFVVLFSELNTSNRCSDVRTIATFKHIYGLGLDWGKNWTNCQFLKICPDSDPKRGRVQENPDIW